MKNATALAIIESRKAYLTLTRDAIREDNAKRYALYFTTAKGVYPCLSYNTLEEIQGMVAAAKAHPGVRSVYVRERSDSGFKAPVSL